MSTDDDGGWQDWPPPEGADGLRLKWRRDESGRWVVTDLHLSASWVTSGMLRAISLPLLEARRNDDAKGVAAWTMVANLPQHERITRPPRTDPEGLEAFYRRVAIAYRTYARMGQHPAPSIAIEADVPVTTVHRWVRESRRRGYLPPGRKGMVG